MKIISNLNHLATNIRASFIQTFEEIKPLPGSPRINRYLAVINGLNGNNFTASGSGFSLDKNIAQNSAIGESIERYCAYLFNENEIKYKSYYELKELGFNVLDPSIISQYTTEQYKMNDYQQIKKNEPISWVQADSSKGKEKIFVPFEMVYLKDPPFNTPFRDVISTGLACGQSKKSAIINGLSECIERDAFMHFWLLGLVNYEIELSTINDIYIRKYLNIAGISNLDLKVYDITTDLKVPTIITIVRPKNKPGFYIGCASALDSLTALKKSINEGFGGFSIYNERIHFFDTQIPNIINSNSTLEDHPLYYLAGNNDHILDKLLLRKIPKKEFEIISLDFDDLLGSLSQNKYDVIYKDLTTVDVKSMGLFVVRVMVPSLAFLSINEPLLNCPRIIEKSNKLNKEINLEPHPFP